MDNTIRRGYRADIDAQSRLAGVVGYPLTSTLSPLIHNVAFTHMGLNWVYLPLRVEPGRLAVALKGLRACGFEGVNVTIPHKLEACRLADELVGDAAITGSVNTLRLDSETGRMTGYSTDGTGFLCSLADELEAIPAGQLFVLGAGGAARAVSYTLASTGRFTEIRLCNRTRERAQELADLLAEHTSVQDIRVLPLAAGGLLRLGDANLVVNTLPASEVDIAGMVKAELFDREQVVCDLDYLQERSPLLRRAEKAGCAVLNGRGVLVHQAAESLRIWTGRAAPVKEMRAALDEHLRDPDQERD